MLFMNWHSVGTKVILITISTLAIIAIAILILFASNEKQKVVDNSIKASKQLLLVSESVRNNTIAKWNQRYILN